MVERLSELEKWRIAELAAQGLPSTADRSRRSVGAHRAVLGQSPRVAPTAGSGAAAFAVAVVVDRA